jgi:DNA-directed RNA polymerase specialized sigma24 family protein
MPFDRWFADQILCHGVSVNRYLNRVWSNRSEIPDLRQDIYVHVYESARDSCPAAPRTFHLTASC